MWFMRACFNKPALLFYVVYRKNFLFWRCIYIAALTQQINEEITDIEIRVIGADGSQLGIMSAETALKLAEEQGFDLVKIAPQAIPPVCRIMDYGKYRFEQAKKDKEARKNQKVVETKELWLSPGIGDHDFNFKLKNGRSFLEEGNKLKVSVRFRGREMAHTEIGTTLLNQFAEACADISTVEKPPKLEGRRMAMFLASKITK